MASFSFAQAAAVKVDDVPKSLPLPKGTYIWQVYKMYEAKPTAKGNGEMVNFPVRLVRTMDDFENPDDLEEYRKVLKTEVGEARVLGFFFPTERASDVTEEEHQKRQDRALRDIRKFLVNDCGVEHEAEDSIQMLCSKALNHQFYGNVIHEKRQNSEEMMDRIGMTSPIS